MTIARIAALLLAFMVVTTVPMPPPCVPEACAQGRGIDKQTQKERDRIKKNKIKKANQRDKNGRIRSSKEYDTDGLLIEEVDYDENGNEAKRTRNTYDPDGDLTDSRVTDATGAQKSRTLHGYDQRKRLHQTTMRGKDDGLVLQADFGYEDTLDYVRSIDIRDSNNARRQRTEYDYDAAGKNTESRAYRNGDSLVATTSFHHDAAGNVRETITRDAGGRQIRRVTFEHDADGNLTRMVTYDENDSLATEETHQYHPKGNVKRSHARVPAAEMEHEVEFDYDNEDNPKEQRTYNKHGDEIDRKSYQYEKHP